MYNRDLTEMELEIIVAGKGGEPEKEAPAEEAAPEMPA